MSTKQCEEKLKDKGVRPTAARILILQKLSEQTYPISLLELEAQLETLDKSTISGDPVGASRRPRFRGRKRVDEIRNLPERHRYLLYRKQAYPFLL